MKRSYSELIKLESFGDRLEYLKLGDGNVKSPRHISQQFYKSRIWLDFRKEIIARDLGYDLGIPGEAIDGMILIHHINPITEDDILNGNYCLVDPENCITMSLDTHNAVHFKPEFEEIERFEGDTKIW